MTRTHFGMSVQVTRYQREPMSQFARVGLRFDELKVDVLARDFEVTDSISSSRYRITPEISAAYSLRSPNRPSISFSFRSIEFLPLDVAWCRRPSA